MKQEFHNFFLFQIGGRELGLPMSAVYEVLLESQVTPIPGTASFVKGLSAVRGKIMSVIDGGERLGIDGNSGGHFLICKVRGNQTAIVIERAVEAGNICVEKVSAFDFSKILLDNQLNERLFNSAWKVFTRASEKDDWISTGRIFLEVIPDQFVSDQMASQLLRA